jgi:acetoin utilization protein AcuB
MNVEPLMTRKVITIEKDDSLLAIREIFENVKFHHLLVVDGQKLIGVISDRDLLSAIPPFSEKECDAAALNKKAHQIMSRILITVDAKTSIEQAGNLLLKNNISCLPVISSQNDIEGILTWKDILSFYLENKEVLLKEWLKK